MPRPAVVATTSSAAPSDAGAPAPSSKPSAEVPAPAPALSVALPPSPDVVVSLFTVGRQSKFRVSDEVDSHSTANDGPTQSGGAVLLRVERTFAVGDVIVAELVWQMPEGFEWVTLPRRWALRDGAVYTVDGPFGPDNIVLDEATIPAVVAKLKPVLTVAAAKRTTQGQPACRDMEEPGNYGPQRVRLCFDRQGISSWLEVNRNGPRLLEVKRVR